ncbi:MAG: diguanylate cyclase [Candidatus Nanopelagicales bacterium]
MRAANGDFHWFANTATRITDAAGHELGRVVGMRNIDAEVEAMATLTQSEARAESAMTSAPGGMAMVDLERRFIQVNDAMATMLGRERTWFEGRGIWEILPPEDDIADQQMRSRLHAGDAESQVGERRLLTAEGSVIWVQHAIGLVRDAHGRPRSYVSQFVDITHTKRRAEQLEYLASHDPLTKLPNRRALDRELALLAEAPRRTGPLAALFIDLDQLKPINDELGHAIGDEILVIVAERIRSVLRTDDIVARIGGDEFVALLPSVRDPDDARAVAEKLRAAVGRDLPDPTWQRVTLSIGVALDTGDSSPEDLLERADLALYRAKHTGRDRAVLYDESMVVPSDGDA